MQRSEAAALISRIVAFDRREADGLTVDAWFDIIGHLDYKPAYQAVLTHYRAAGAYPIRPGEVIQRVVEQHSIAQRTASDALAIRHRAELLNYLDGRGYDQATQTATLTQAMFEFEGQPHEVEAARGVLRRHERERRELEAAHGDEIGRLQLEPVKPKVSAHEEWRYR